MTVVKSRSVLDLCGSSIDVLSEVASNIAAFVLLARRPIRSLLVDYGKYDARRCRIPYAVAIRFPVHLSIIEHFA